MAVEALSMWISEERRITERVRLPAVVPSDRMSHGQPDSSTNTHRADPFPAAQTQSSRDPELAELKTGGRA